MKPLRVLHIITGLGVGGAERMLVNLLERAERDPRGLFTSEVISLRAAGPMAEPIQALGVPVRGLNMRPNLPNPLLVARLAGWIRQSRPDVVQTWMYHANLIGGAAVKLAGHTPLAWAIHQTAIDFETFKPATLKIVRASAWASRWMPDAVVCVAEASRETHAGLGYDRSRMRVIPNGFDTQRFKPDPAARQAARRSLGIPMDAPALGMFARFHPMKNHANFLRAAGLVQAQLPEARFILCGQGVDQANPQLAEWAAEAGLGGERLHLLGPRDDIPALLAALDLYVSPSRREAFPMSIGEAMACGVPCVVTDVGDSALMIADTGRVVPQADPAALAEACLELLRLPEEERKALGEAARSRVEQEYNLEGIAQRYAQLYRSLIVSRK